MNTSLKIPAAFFTALFLLAGRQSHYRAHDLRGPNQSARIKPRGRLVIMRKPFLPAGFSRFGRNACFLAFLLLCFLPRAAWAIVLVATDGSNLARFDSAVLGSVTTVPVSGMQASEVLVGIDYRPGTGPFTFGIHFPSNRAPVSRNSLART